MYIQGIPTQSLIDTDSAVSNVSKKFYDTHLSDIPLQSVDKFLTFGVQMAPCYLIMVSSYASCRLMAFQ